MKRFMISALASAYVAMATATPLNPKTCTEQEVRTVIAEVLSLTNGYWLCGKTNNLWDALWQPRFYVARAEVDDVLSARGYSPDRWWSVIASYPKMARIAIAKTGADISYAKSMAIAMRLGANVDPLSFLAHGCTLEDLAAFLSESVAFPTNCSLSVWHMDNMKLSIQKRANKAIKRYLRSQGKSFVSKNGVNPCESYMTTLTTALNESRLAGLDAWYRHMGLGGVDLSSMPSEAEIEKLRQDILNGDRDMTERDKSILYVCLGVDGYNAFVREYNGE